MEHLMMTSEERMNEMTKRLNAYLSPNKLTIIDNSAAHAGHAGHRGAGHFSIQIAAAELRDKTPIQAHRLIYQALGDLMDTEIHALSIAINE